MANSSEEDKMAREKLIVKRKKRKGAGKRVGNNFQWEVCKKLSLSVSDRDDIFQPTPSSGARGTQRKKKQETQATQHGDITYEDPIGKPLIDIWSMECKSGYGRVKETKQGITKTNWCLLDCIEGDSQNPKFIEFWLQALEDAEASNREPVLIFRRNKKQACIAFRKSYVKSVLLNYYGLFKTFTYDNITIEVSDESIFTISFKDFLDWTNGKLLDFANDRIKGGTGNAKA
jgi:hypothetical protein